MTRPVLAFDLGGTRLKAGLVVSGEVTALSAEPVAHPEDGDAVVAQLVATGRALAGAAAVAAVGASVKGIVDSETGVLAEVNQTLRSLTGRPLAAELRGAFGVPVAIENDARLYALGEARHGAGMGARNLVGITLGTGIGCGVILDGRPAGGLLGGHLTVDWQGDRCDCGNVGCLEMYASAGALTEYARGLGAAPADAEAVFAAAAAGDPACRQAVERLTRMLGVGVVSWIHAYDPEVVVIGGGMAGSAGQFIDGVRAYARAHAWTVPRDKVRIEVSRLREQAALLGAAELALTAGR